MAKALLGQKVHVNDRLLMESDRLRSRVRDLESMIEDLQRDLDRLRADRAAGLPAEIDGTRQPVH